MATSSTVTAGSAAYASDYNNLRTDVLNTSTGHVHDGTNGRSMFGSPVAVGTANSDGTGTAYARNDHVHAVAVGTAAGSASGNVTYTNPSTWYTIASATGLGAGVWSVSAFVAVQHNATNDPGYEVRLTMAGATARWMQMVYTYGETNSLFAFGTLAAAGTILLEGRRTSSSYGGTALTGSHFIALRVSS